jgi:hypothetical protein
VGKGLIRRVMVITFATMLVFGVMTSLNTSYAAEPKGHRVQVMVNGGHVEFNADMGEAYLSQENRIMIPIRVVSEKMDYAVDWEGDTRTAVITGEGVVLRLPVDKDTATKDGETIKLDTKTVLREGRVYVPLRFVSEAMGGTVNYDSHIDSKGYKIHLAHITTPFKNHEDNLLDPTFDPGADVRADGRLTKEKTTEYIEKMIEGTTLKKENGKYILEFERPAIAEGFKTGIGFQVLTHSGDGGYSLRSTTAVLPENQLPGNQSFVMELDPERMSDVNFYKFTFGVAKPGSNTSTAYEIWYWPDTGRSEYVQTNEYGHTGDYLNFDKNRLFEGL